MGESVKRVIVKMSGEALGGTDGQGINQEVVQGLGKQLIQVRELGIEVGLVVGGGNIFRGVQGSSQGMDPVMADFMGMMATVINGAGVCQIFRAMGIPAVLSTPFAMPQYAEQHSAEKSRTFLAEGKVVVFAGGTGNPFVTTDSGGALRAAEVGADLLIKATKVNGIYDGDPVQNPDAKLFKTVRFNEVLGRGLKVMDAGAIALCEQRNIPIRVLNIFEKNGIVELLKGADIGTLVH